MSGEALSARLAPSRHQSEHKPARDAASAPQAILCPARKSLREAKARRRATRRPFIAAMKTLTDEQHAAIAAYVAALGSEAAANRVEARELRERIAHTITPVTPGVANGQQAMNKGTE